METSQKITPAIDGRHQKESDQTEESQSRGNEVAQTYSNVEGKTPKVYD